MQDNILKWRMDGFLLRIIDVHKASKVPRPNIFFKKRI